MHCGICRQTLIEFGEKIMVNKKGDASVATAAGLLSAVFTREKIKRYLKTNGV